MRFFFFFDRGFLFFYNIHTHNNKNQQIIGPTQLFVFELVVESGTKVHQHIHFLVRLVCHEFDDELRQELMDTVSLQFWFQQTPWVSVSG